MKLDVVWSLMCVREHVDLTSTSRLFTPEGHSCGRIWASLQSRQTANSECITAFYFPLGEYDNECLLIYWHILQQPCGIHCQRQTCALTTAATCWREQRARDDGRASMQHVPLNPVTHFSQLGLAGRERCTCCPNNWDCKVNVRRKLRTPTLPLPPTQPNPATQQQAFISQLAAHQQISHQNSLELLLLLLLVVTGFPPIESDVNKDSWVTSQRDVRRVWYEISLQEQRNDHRH